MAEVSRILLDTNLLLLYAAGCFDPRLIGRKRLDTFTSDDFDLVCNRLDSYQTRVTTPHVLTELSNLLTQLVDKKEHYRLRQFLQTFLTQFRELHHPASEICATKAFPRLGLTDAAIVLAARTNTEVLTDDLDLHLFLRSQVIPSTNLNHLRQI